LISHYQPFGCCEALRLLKSASFGYFSLHKQRTSDSLRRAKALAVAVAVAFNKQQIKRKSSGASSALRDHCHLHELPWMISLRLLRSASHFTSLRLWKSASRG
jgi:hypothetical protein